MTCLVGTLPEMCRFAVMTTNQTQSNEVIRDFFDRKKSTRAETPHTIRRRPFL